MALRAGTRLHAVLWVALLLVAQLAGAQGVQVERASPAVKTAAPGHTVTHVFALQGSGTVQVRLTSEHGWPLLTRERTIALEAGRPYYFPVTLRVPEGVPAGTRDRLRLQADGASADAFTEVAYAPGLEAHWPAEVAYVPPFGRFALEVANTGNGADVVLVRLLTLQGVPVYQARLPLEPGERRELRVTAAEPRVLRVVVRLERGGLEREGYLAVQPARAKGDGAFRLLGRLGAAYRYPGDLSFSLGAAGPLSDFTHFSLGAGYAPGGSPAGVLGFSWDGGFLSAAFGPSYGLALGLFEGAVSTQIALSGPVWRGSMNFDVSGRGYGFGAAALLDEDPSLRLRADLATGKGKAATFRPGTLTASLTLRPFRPQLNGDLAYGFSYRDWPMRLQGGFTGVPAAPVEFHFSADVNPEPFSVGGRLTWTGLGVDDWGLAAASSSERLDLDLPLAVTFGAAAGPDRLRAFARSRLDLPAPWSDLSAEARAGYQSGRWTFTLSGGSEASAAEGLALVQLDGQLGWPLDENEVKLGLRAGGSYLRTRADLAWAPWKPRFRTALALELPAGGALLRARADREWYAGRTSLGLGAEVPLVLEVPAAVTRLFGGRNVGIVAGEVRVEGPARLREGLVVRAGGREARTDAEGRFRLEVPPGRYTVEVVEARLPAVLVPVRGRVEVEVGLKRTVRAELVLAARSVLEGRVRVVVEPGRELPPRRFAVSIEDALGRRTSLFTDPGGAFTVPALAPGRYTVRLLEDLLPDGWEALVPAATVLLRPGETARVELAVRPPLRKVYTGGSVQILEVRPEADRVPPGSAPLVEVRLRGAANRVVVTLQDRIAGILLPAAEEEGLWRGRLHVPVDAEGPLALQVEALNGALARYPFFLSVSPDAPWGVVRSLPVARPGQTLEVAVHWYAPVESSWLQVGDERIPLQGQGADWAGAVKIPQDAQGRYRFAALARLANGEEVQLVRWILIRQSR
ncbi:hypothetical protein ACMC9I_01235 [Deinococcota bacterium DY0809b]